MLRSFQLRLCPTHRQRSVLTVLLAHLCGLYNDCLWQRRDAWKVARKHIHYFDQQAELTQLRRQDEESRSFPVAIQRDPLRRLERAFQGFFRRIRHRQQPGYPRFRSEQRYDSFEVDGGNFRLEGTTVVIVKLGGFRFKTRCRIRGTPKVLHVKRCGKHWRAVLVCDIGAAAEKVMVVRAVGLDLGLSALATLSDGTTIRNPRWTEQMEKQLGAANRALARKQRGSRNRAKAGERLRRVHQRIQGRRRSYLHQISAFLVSRYDLVAFEQLNIRGLARTRLAKSILDAAWRELTWQIIYKAEEAGKWAVGVNARGTTQMCSACGQKVAKQLHERQHQCPHCGLTLGRDHNAALNILRLGESLVGVSAKC